MAVTQSFLAQNRLGNRVEKYIKATITGGNGVIETGLKRCLVALPVQIGPAGGTIDMTVRAFPNFSDAGSSSAPGKVYMDNVTTGGVYAIRVVGN